MSAPPPTGFLEQVSLLLRGDVEMAERWSRSWDWRRGSIQVAMTVFGLRFLRHGFSQFSARSQAGLRIWSVIFLLVVLQMTTAFRPIVGPATTFLPTEKKFFLDHWLENLKATEGAVRPRV